MKRTEYDFDVISGPSTPVRQQPAPKPAPQPQPAGK